MSTSHGNLFLRWKKSERYHREISAIRSRASCANWRQELLLPHFWKKVDSSSSLILGEPISPSFRSELQQIELGANTKRKEMTGEEYLRAHPIDQFTIGINTGLTALYGKSFAGSVYKAWVESQPENARTKSAFLAHLKSLRAGKEADARFVQATAPYHVLIVMGLGWDQSLTSSTPAYVRDFVTEIQSLGIRTTLLHNEPMGSLRRNVALVRPQIEQALRSGENVILFGLCTGAPEVLAAAAEAISPYLDADRTQAHRPPGYGRIAGVITLSGMFRGTFLADFAGRIVGLDLLGSLLKRLPSQDWSSYGRYPEALKPLTISEVEKLNSEYLTKLPVDLPYVQGSGVVPGDGLISATDSTAMRPFQEMDRDLHMSAAANDGFIEYPGNQLPAESGIHAPTLVFDSTHMITDGAIGGVSLLEPANRRLAYRAIYLTLIDLMEKR